MSLFQHRQIETDILVAGGGISGVCCALAAARRGAKVVLCQDRPVLGGNASSEIRMHICGADVSGGRGGDAFSTETREGGIMEEIRLETCMQNPQRSPSVFDMILYDKCRTEPNLTLMLNTTVTDAEMSDGQIVAATAERPSTEDVFRIQAKVYVDCTGDGMLGAAAGAEFRSGREGRDEYGESMATDKADSLRLGSSLLFMARKHDRPMPYVAPSWARKFTEEDLRLRHHAQAGVDVGLEYGYWWMEWGGTLDTIKDNEAIRDELMAIAYGVWGHIKNGGDHGADCWALDWVGAVPGKRESRRFIGQYVLTQNDVMESRAFEDAIAYGGWPIDTHPYKGVDAPDETPCSQTFVPLVFDIPLRCSISKNISNLMFAGRNLSTTHIAFASTRVMATCGVVGQGVGTAAAYSVKNSVSPAQLSDSKEAIETIQQQLLADDAYLIGKLNQDEKDLARRATVTASSHVPGGEPENVLSGQTRSIHGEKGAPADRANEGSHRWISDPACRLPATISLSWDAPQEISRVEIVFDTAMHKALTLSQSEQFAQMMDWGNPRPETLRDYQIEGCVDGQWKQLVSVEGNYQRKRKHLLAEPVVVSGLRIVANATNGLDHARILEIRVYGQ